MDNQKPDSFLARELDAQNLVDGVLAVSPNLALYFWTGSLLWFHGALVTMCLLILQTRTGHSLALLATHAVTMAVLTSFFYLAIPSTGAFVLIVVATGFATFWIMRLDSRLDSFGVWNFIPPLYPWPPSPRRRAWTPPGNA